MAAVIKTGKRNPYDSGGPLKLDIAEDIDFLAPEQDLPFLSLLGWGATAEDVASASFGAKSLRTPAISTTHTWLNDELVQSTGTTTANYTSGGGTITVGVAQILALRIDDVIVIDSTDTFTKQYYLILTINTGAGTFTVTALNADGDSNSGDVWTLLGSAKKEGAAANTDGKHTVLAQSSNFCQTFSDDVFVTGTEQSTEQYGITDPLAREIKKTAMRMVISFERAVHYNLRSTTLPADSLTAARMGGLYYYQRVATSPDGLRLDLAGAPITEKTMDDMIDTIWRTGGRPDTIMMNSVALRELKKFNRPFTQTSRTEKTAGLVVDRYESAQGIALDVVLDRHLHNSDILIVTKNLLGVGPLEGNGNSRHFVAEEVPWTGGDYRQANIRGQYTMEVRNRSSHHLWAFGASTTVSS